MATNLYYILACAIVAIMMVDQSVAEEHGGHSNETYTAVGMTDYIFRWHGEFIGSIHFDIPVEIDGWELTLTFQKKLRKNSFVICPAKVVEIIDRQIVHMTSHPWNSHIEENGKLSMWFNAGTWKKLRGLRAEATFTGYVVPDMRNQTSNETESSESSSSRSDFSSEGINNGLQCRNDFSNVTCGSEINIIQTGGLNTVEMRIPVNFNQVVPEQISVFTDKAVSFVTAPTYNYEFQPLSGQPAMISIPKPQTETDARDKRFMMVRLGNLPLEDLQEAGRGHLYVQISFGAGGDKAVIFPYIEGTPSCLCTRLKITGQGFDM